MTARQHTASHDLPISYGYGGSWGPDRRATFAVGCGRCGGELFLPTEEWVTRYFTAREREIRRSHDRGYLTDGQQLDALAEFARKRDELLLFITEESAE